MFVTLQHKDYNITILGEYINCNYLHAKKCYHFTQFLFLIIVYNNVGEKKSPNHITLINLNYHFVFHCTLLQQIKSYFQIKTQIETQNQAVETADVHDNKAILNISKAAGMASQ